MNELPQGSSRRLARIVSLIIVFGFIGTMGLVARYVFVSADSFEYPEEALPNGLMSSPFISPSIEVSPSFAPTVSPSVTPSVSPTSNM